jgi:hypothetical protein
MGGRSFGRLYKYKWQMADSCCKHSASDPKTTSTQGLFFFIVSKPINFFILSTLDADIKMQKRTIVTFCLSFAVSITFPIVASGLILETGLSVT